MSPAGTIHIRKAIVFQYFETPEPPKPPQNQRLFNTFRHRSNPNHKKTIQFQILSDIRATLNTRHHRLFDTFGHLGHQIYAETNGFSILSDTRDMHTTRKSMFFRYVRASGPPDLQRKPEVFQYFRTPETCTSQENHRCFNTFGHPSHPNHKKTGGVSVL